MCSIAKGQHGSSQVIGEKWERAEGTCEGVIFELSWTHTVRGMAGSRFLDTYLFSEQHNVFGPNESGLNPEVCGKYTILTDASLCAL